MRFPARLRMILGAILLLAGMQAMIQQGQQIQPARSAFAEASAPFAGNLLPERVPDHWQLAENQVYLPLVTNNRLTRRVNLPYFAETSVQDIELAAPIVFTETAIFWFGRVSPAENYTDVRVGYNDDDLYLRLAIFDRLLWYDPSPSAADLTQWDSASLFLNLDGTTGAAPNSRTYRFDAALGDFNLPRTAWQAAYQGNGASWSATSLTFSTVSGYSWESGTVGGVNNNQNNRGWLLTFRIPFASLGLSGPPVQGSAWGAALAVHDRESASSPPLPDQTWPESATANNPQSWGVFSFGLPASPAIHRPGELTTIREEAGVRVPDAAVGGTTGNLCPGDPAYIWSGWADESFGNAADFNVQNQASLADWPCFAKYYVTFPLDRLPQGAVIHSATLTLHHWGGSDLSKAQPSLLQVMTVAEDWDESFITWNNAPLAAENIARTWEGVYSVVSPSDWPGQAVVWDVTIGVVRAASRKLPLRLVLYSADGAIHSGKYFTTSETGDWNLPGRPTLTVQWSTP